MTVPGPTTVTVLGSTGSIGTQTLAVIDEHPERFRVTGLAAGTNADLLVAQARAHRVERVAVADPEAAVLARAALGPGVEVLDGPGSPAELAGDGADVVVNGLVGSRGLGATLAALGAGSRLALANKESLIVGGPLVLAASRAASAGGDGPRPAATGTGGPRPAATGTDGTRIVPVDSEHSALAQCLRAGARREVARLIVTASGGPFRGRGRAQLADVTVEDALAHPTWAMGAVITVNSATLANKGLEVIEAHLLFGVPFDAIDVVVHPQSVVHGIVEFTDGSSVAQLSPPDMRLPIQFALGWPDRLPTAPSRLDWMATRTLEFEPVDADTFPMVSLAVAAGRAGGTAPAVFNAANEEAVAAFLDRRLTFLGIAGVVEATLEAEEPTAVRDLETVLEAEHRARRHARALIGARQDA